MNEVLNSKVELQQEVDALTKKGENILMILNKPEIKNALEKLISSPYEFARLFEAFFSTVALSPGLLGCNPKSIVDAFLRYSEFSGTYEPEFLKRQYSYLVPRFSKGSNLAKCEYELSYKGLSHIATKECNLKVISAQVIREGENFKANRKDNRYIIEHEFSFYTGKDPTKEPAIVGAYAHCVSNEGVESFTLLNKRDLERIREAAPGKSLAWNNYESEMYCKSAVKRLCKHLLLTSGNTRNLLLVEDERQMQMANIPEPKAIDNKAKIREALSV